MARARIKVIGITTTSAKADTFEAAVESEMPASDKVYDRPFNWARSVDGSNLATVLDIRFNQTADAAAVWQRLKDKVAILRSKASGKLSYHICTHDEAIPINCRQSSFEEVTLGA